MKNLKKKVISLLILAALAGPAMAAKAVIDVANLARNAVTSIQSQRQTLLMIQQYQNMVQDLILQTKNLQKVDPGLITRMVDRGLLPSEALAARDGAEVAKAAAGVYAQLKSGQDNLIKASNVLNLIDSKLDYIQRIASTAGMNPNDVVQMEARDAAAGRDWKAKNFLAIKDGLDQLNVHRARTDEIVKNLPQANGALQALQSNGAQMAVISDQLSQMIQVQSVAAAATTEQSIKREDETLDVHRVRMMARARNCQMGLSQAPDCQQIIQYVKKAWPRALEE